MPPPTRNLFTTTTASNTTTRDLFAPTLSRRPLRSTPTGDVFADAPSPTGQRRKGSPDAKTRGKKVEEEEEFVVRGEDGGFLLQGPGEGLGGRAVKEEGEGEVEEVDRHYVSIARHYFVKGGALERGGKGSEEDLESLRLPMMMRLKEQVMQQLEEERWMYEGCERAGVDGLR